MRVLRALGAALLIPALALALAAVLLGEGSFAPQALWPNIQACVLGLPTTYACTAGFMAPGLAAGAVAAGALGLAILAVYWLTARLCGANRLALAWVFPAVTLIALLAVALLTLSHAGLVGLGIFAAESYWLGEVHPWILAVVAGLGGLAAMGVAFAALRSFRNVEVTVIGAPLNPMDQPRIMLMVRKIAKDVGAKAPDNVIVGMDANFFVTNASVRLLGTPYALKGRNLYLSVPMMRGLSSAELGAVIAHEMSHFANKDLAYSARFAPIYARLAHAADPSPDGRAPANPFFLPVRAFTDFMVGCFHANVAKVSQVRELAADARAAVAATPEDQAYALLKVSLMAFAWHREMQSVYESASRGRFARNISMNFADQLRLDLDRDKLGDMAASILAWHAPHPTDSHPATDERIQALGLDPNALIAQTRMHDRFFAQSTASQDLDDLQKIEEQLSFIYQKYLEHQGAVARELDGEEMARHMLIDFIALMVTADGVIDDRELDTAEKECVSFIPEFDARDLRERCRHPAELPEIDKLIELSIHFLTPQGFKKLTAILEKIALADGMRDRSEDALLQRALAAAELAADHRTT
jgi:Zn-dependent protease with chaperone function